MKNGWLTQAAKWRDHAEEFGLSNLDGTTIRHMIDFVKKDIAEHEKIVADIGDNAGAQREADEMKADIAEARKLVDTFTAALHVRASA